MISVEECRKLIGKSSRKMTDEEIIEVRDNLYQLGEIIFEQWLIEQKLTKDS